MAHKIKVGIFGGNGSIGRSAIDVIRLNECELSFITYHKGGEFCQEIARELNCIAISHEQQNSYPTVDISIIGISGIAGITHTLDAIRISKVVAIANKESIVCGWHIIKAEAAKYGTRIIPVDSEHNSLFQLIQGFDFHSVQNYIITTSGGPFRQLPAKELQNVAYKDVFKHPVWDMGQKILVDSATMMNKALEVIEAIHLFDISPDKIKVVCHPQCLVHAGIELNNGSVIPFVSNPDMKVHIAHAIFETLSGSKKYDNGVKKTSLLDLNGAEFLPLNEWSTGVIEFAKEIATDPILCNVFNAANETANELFRIKEISFHEIHGLVFDSVEEFRKRQVKLETVEDILAMSKLVGDYVKTTINTIRK